MKSYVGYSTNSDIRYRATSGGVGTSLIKWMFDKGVIGTSVSFDFDARSLKYVPKMIHSFSEYKISGSIYQEIDLINFIKTHINNINGTFACFTLPCQTRAIRTIVEKAGHKTIIIGLTCSSQQTLDATKFLLKRMKINTKNVCNLQYRGNGWPSGIQIETNTGKNFFVANNKSVWNEIFHSRLFIREKCFMCQNTLNEQSDIALADPWLNEYKSEKQGLTICTSFSLKGYNLLSSCSKDGYINLRSIPYDKLIESQKGTIQRKKYYRDSLSIINNFKKIINNPFYRFLILECNLFVLHNKLRTLFEKMLKKE